VAHDVRHGYVSAEAARNTYRVVLNASGEVDTAATAALRKSAPNAA
jgi:N-methylhydantoinase B